MHTHLEKDLDNLKESMYKMLDLSVDALKESIESLRTQDIDRAKQVIKNDKKIDKFENAIDEECIKILVTRQPAATDARLIHSILKINTDIERIADLSAKIAKQTVKIGKQKLLKPLVDIPRMSEICIQMLKDVLESIVTMNAELAEEVILRDDILDDINTQLYRELITFINENPSILSQALCLIEVSKSLERIGDHIKNIAERSIYYIEGKNIRHKGR
ncbi:MAG: phosphate signaling complex protein PhoU [Spirochaetes bacterium]|nr:phosphate signaling complex protein PhoU [Spirochaetota bacterium]